MINRKEVRFTGLKGRQEKARRIALDLCKMCKRENLTVSEFLLVVEYMQSNMRSTTTVMDRLLDFDVPKDQAKNTSLRC